MNASEKPPSDADPEEEPTIPPSIQPPELVETEVLDALRQTGVGTFGDYSLESEIARGGMGVVFKARQISLDRTVALKMIIAGQLAGEDDIRRFRVEAEAAAKLEHPNIVPIYEVGELDGQHFFSMAYVGGESLAQRIARVPLSPFECAKLLRKIADAMAYAHSNGIIHRDLKPANILLDEKNEPKITDFGVAKRIDRDSTLTATGQVLGTPSYMAPEQASGKRLVGESADVYSLGAILYAMLTGRPPFSSPNSLDTLIQVLESEATLPTRLASQVPKSLERICMRCLEKQPAARYPSAAALSDELERFLQGEPIEAKASDTWHKVRRWTRREPALAAHAAGLVLVFLVLQVNFLLAGVDYGFHLKVTGILGAWCGTSVLLQKWMNRTRRFELVAMTWAVLDAGMFTALLYMADPPIGPLVAGYAVMISMSGMFFRVRLVVVMTAASISSYLVLLWCRAEPIELPHYPAIFIAMLVVLGTIVAAQVRRVRVLSRYLDRDDNRSQ